MIPSPICISTFPETSQFAKKMWLLGCVLEAVGYGILLPLAFTCLQALRRRKGGGVRVNRGLIAYTLVATALATAVEVSDLIKTFYTVLDETCVGPYMHIAHPYLGPKDVLSFTTTLLTDGLLVWRCYAIASGLKGRRWFAFLWLVPLFIYILALGTSIATLTGVYSPPQKQAFLAILFPIHLGISAFLNILITSIIVSLLFCHRRMMIRAFGREQHLPLLNIMVILAESAALIVVVDVIVIVSIISLGSVGEMVSQVWCVVQPIASLLIIERVSRNSDYFNRTEESFQYNSSVASNPTHILVSLPPE